MDAEPRPATAYQEAIDSRGVNDRDKRCVFDTADLAPPGIEYREPDEFGAEEHFFGNHRGPSISKFKAATGHVTILLQLVLQEFIYGRGIRLSSRRFHDLTHEEADDGRFTTFVLLDLLGIRGQHLINDLF